MQAERKNMLKLKSMTFEDETGKEIVAELPEAFDLPIPGDTELAANVAAGCILVGGYEWLQNVFPSNGKIK